MYERVSTAEATSQFFIADSVGMKKENMKYAAPVMTM